VAARDPRWSFIEVARRALLDAFNHDGVTRIEVVAAFPHLDDFGIWLCTATDKERDALPRVNPRIEEVRSILLSAGFPSDQLTGLSTTAQSQETVDRQYEGSWFYALR
jgi:hypothetical protein